MPRSPRLAVAAPLLLVAVLAVLGWVSAEHVPTHDDVTGLWPVGLGAGAVVLTRGWWRVLVALAVGVVVIGAAAAADAPTAFAVGYGAGVAAGVWVTARVLEPRGGGRPRLHTDDDLRRYFAAAFAGAVVAGAAVAVAASVAGLDDGGRAGLAVGIAHAASHLCLVPLFLRLPLQGAIARAGERTLQWLFLLVAIPLLLLPDASPSVAFLLLPILLWGALRTTPAESLAQLVGVMGVAVVLTTYGHGPFADVPRRYDLPADARGMLLSAFAATGAVIVVPVILRVGEYVGAARAASAERDLVRGILDGATGVAIIVTDPSGRITLFNPGAEELLGYRADEVVGGFTPMFHTDAAVAAVARSLGVDADFGTVVATLVERRLTAVPVRFRRKDGVERVHAMTVTKLGGDADPTGYVATSEDITDQLDTEGALREALDVERRAVERLQEVDAVKDQFVSTVSHELRTPITSILGYLELLADGSLGELASPQVAALVRVQSNSQRLLALIDDLLTLSRVAEQGLDAIEQPFDLRDAVGTAYDVVAPAWGPPRTLPVGLSVPERAVGVKGDRAMVERMVVNLVGNAVKFTDDDGSVEVQVDVDVDAHESVLRVVDTGIGIPLDEQDRLFERFFRSTTAERRAIPGSGLGLSIAQAVAEQHRGSIAITSAPGVGTTVEVRLPSYPGMSKIQLPL